MMGETPGGPDETPIEPGGMGEMPAGPDETTEGTAPVDPTRPVDGPTQSDGATRVDPAPRVEWVLPFPSSPPTPAPPAATSWILPGESSWSVPATAAVSLYDDATPRALRRLVWIIGILGAVTGLGAMQGLRALNGHLDKDLVSTDEIATLETGLLIIRVAALGAILVTLILGRRWLAAVGAELVEGQTAGVVDPDARGRAVLLAAAGSRPDPTTWRGAQVGSDRRRTRIVVAIAAIALVLQVVGTVASLLAWELQVARVAAVMLVIGALVWLVAAGLVAGWISRIERREAATLAATRANLISVPTARRLSLAMIVAAIAYLALLPSAYAPRLEDGQTCETTDFECVFMTVQQDQLDGSPRSPTTRLAYARRRADGTRIGTMIIAVGGPGSGGLILADAIARGLPTRVLETYDIVIYDPRGVGSSDPLECPEAATAYHLQQDPVTAIGQAARFASACVEESGLDAATLATYGTDHTVEDIEAIREDLGAERIVLYGESYGTVVAQRYAALHGDRLQALILDGVVDLGQSSTAMWTEATRGFETVLDHTFVACRADADCQADLPDPAETYDRLLDILGRQPPLVSFGDVDGTVRQHLLSDENLLDVASQAMYTPGDRALFLRALAAAVQRDWVPLGQLANPGGRIVFTPDDSSLTYFAVGCADFRHDPAEQIDSVDAYVRAGEAVGLFALRQGSTYLSGAPCLAWPSRRAATGPFERLTSTEYPVFVLTAEDDPITPPAEARRVSSPLTNGYLFVTAGGPHVTFANGNPCPDDILAEYLVEGVLPSSRELRCPGEVIDPYTSYRTIRPLSQLDAFEAAEAIDLEIYLHPDYNHWDGRFSITFGCRFGGTVELAESEHEYAITFNKCKVFEDVPVSGAGSYRYDGSVSLKVVFGGNDLLYTFDTDGNVRISGTYDGAFISESR